MTRALIVGGCGFIGSSLAETLVDHGFDVRIFDRPGAISPLPEYLRARMEWMDGDFTDEAAINRALSGQDVVFHLASTTLPKSSNDDPVYDVYTNIGGTLRLLAGACRRGIRRVIFASSGGTVYGVPTTVPTPETHQTNPLSSYGITKLAIEKYLELFRVEHGLDYIILRIANPYGRYQNPRGAQGAATVFLARALNRQPIEIWGDGEVVRDYIYISDVVDAMLAAVTYVPGPRLFNVGSGQGRSLNEVVEAIRQAVGRDMVVHYLPGRSVDVPSNVLDIGLISSCMGWQPKVTFEQGIQLMLKAWRSS
jgi:UDP-glucose 4-epimerase